MKHCIWAALLFLPMLSWAQRAKIDSVLAEIRKFQASEGFEYQTKYINSLNHAAFFYNTLAPDSAVLLGREAERLSIKANYADGQMEALRCIGLGLRAEPLKAMESYRKAVQLAEEKGFRHFVWKASNNMGMLCYEQGCHPKALEYFLLAFTTSDEFENDRGRAASLANLLKAYSVMGRQEECLQASLKYVEIKELLGESPFLGLYQAGLLYAAQGRHEEALLYGNKALLSGTEDEKAHVFCLMGNSSLALHRADSAVRFLEKSLLLAEKGSREACRALVYLSRCFLYKKDPARALEYLEQAQKNADKSSLVLVSQAYSDCYKQMGRHEQALASMEQCKAYQEALLQEETQAQLKALAMQNAFDMQEAQMRAEQEAQKQDKERWRERSLIGALLFGLLAVAYFWRRAKAEAPSSPESAEIVSPLPVHESAGAARPPLEPESAEAASLPSERESEEAASQPSAQSFEADQQQEGHTIVVRDLRTLLLFRKDAHLEILNSDRRISEVTRYALDVQRAILPSEEELLQFFAQAFIIYKPKDKVSADFYWYSRIDSDTAVFALADCSGHGPPGAFMSTYGSLVLHKTVRAQNIDNPAGILGEMDPDLLKVPDPKRGLSNDPVAMALCVFRKKEAHTEVVFAGARMDIFVLHEGEMLRIKGNKHYVGSHAPKKEFENQRFVFPFGTKLYFATDGFVDQSNSEGRRFGSLAFQNLLLETASLPQQKEALMKALRKHQGISRTFDDVSVVGLTL